MTLKEKEIIKKYRGLSELDREIVKLLIKKITILLAEDTE
jgi:hypothetical protein